MNKLILIAAVVLLLGVGSYFVFTGGYAPSQPNQTSQQNQQPSITENKIVIKNFTFSPATLTIKSGATVTWANEDPVPHNIKSDTFNSEVFNKGESFQFKFNNTGTYDYTCGIHPNMKGEIIVQD